VTVTSGTIGFQYYRSSLRLNVMIASESAILAGHRRRSLREIEGPSRTHRNLSTSASPPCALGACSELEEPAILLNPLGVTPSLAAAIATPFVLLSIHLESSAAGSSKGFRLALSWMTARGAATTYQSVASGTLGS